MTKEEFESLSVGGLQKLLKKLTGKLSISRDRPFLFKLARPLAWSGVAITDIVDAEEKTVAPRKAKTKAAAKPKAKPKAPPKKKAAAKAKPANGKAPATESSALRAAREIAIRKIAKDKTLSIRKICRAAEAAKIPTARGGKNWTTASVVAILERA